MSRLGCPQIANTCAGCKLQPQNPWRVPWQAKTGSFADRLLSSHSCESTGCEKRRQTRARPDFAPVRSTSSFSLTSHGSSSMRWTTRILKSICTVRKVMSLKKKRHEIRIRCGVMRYVTYKSQNTKTEIEPSHPVLPYLLKGEHTSYFTPRSHPLRY